MRLRKLVFFLFLSVFFGMDISSVNAQSSLYLPGATNWVSVGDLDVSGNQLTVEALIYYTGASVNIVSKHTNPGDVNYLLRIGSFEITTTAGYANFGGVAAAGVSIVPNRMYHVAATYDGAMLRYYVNGCMTGSMAWTGNMVQNNLITAIGNQSSCACEQFTGYIDEVRIWNVARTQAQIQANMMNLPSPTTQPGLLGYWKFDGSMVNLQGNASYDGVAMGAPQYQPIPLPYPSPIHETVSGSDPVCAGSADGLINVAASGYYTPYEYSIDGVSYGSSSQFSGLPAGNYTVYTRPQNNNNCVTSSSITLTDPPVLNANLTTNDVSCNGANDGSASVAPSGGDGPVYHQSWAPSLGSTTNITNLSPGNYSVTVQDTCRAAGPEMVINGQFEDGNTGFSSSYACCAGGPGNYAVDVDPTYYNGGHIGNGFGGGGNYLIADGSTTPGTSLWCQTIAVTPNTYYTFSTWVASDYTTSLALVEFDINGSSVGTISAPATTSTWTQFQTVWYSGGATTANICIYDQNTVGGGNDFGIDNISFKTCNSCSATVPFTISEPAALSLTTSQTDVSCFGGSNGTATVTASGGTAPYSYSWNTTPVQTTASATGLAAGNYTVTVTDAHLCTSTASVTINSPAVLTATIASQSDVSCFGGNDGNASVSVAGGTATYTYSWNSAPVQTIANAIGLTAGSYTVTVNDQLGCSTTAVATIAEPSKLTPSLTSQTDVSCNGNQDGSATIAVTGGSPLYSYQWNTVPVQSSPNATSLGSGNYTCTVTDDHGCIDSVAVTITEPALLNLTLSTYTDVSCFGANNGTATVTAAGGTGSYSYSWNTVPAQSTATAINMPAGNYTATVTDANGCSDTANVLIQEPAQLAVSVTAQSNPSCFGGNDGSIQLSTSGGSGTIAYNWTPAVSTSSSGNSLSSGNYSITLTDSLSCSQTISVTLSDPTLLTIAASASPNSICLNAATNLSSVANGGSGSLAYQWSNGIATASQTISPVSSTSYSVTVTDSLGCTAVDSVVVTVNIPATLFIGNDTSICQGQSLTLNAGSGFASYEWQNGANTASISASTANLYFVNAIDANGCQVSDSLVLSVFPLPVIGLPDTLHFCPGNNVSINANTGYASYTWNNGATTSSLVSSIPGTYFVTVMDVNGCSNYDTTTVYENPVPQLNFLAQPPTGCSPLDVTLFNTSLLNGATVQSWTWYVGTASYTNSEPSITLPAGTYTVSLEAITSDGCFVDTTALNYINVLQSPTAVIVSPSSEYELYDNEISLYNGSQNSDSYDWFMNDVLISQQLNITYPIADTGHFTFQLVAINNNGCTDTTDVLITVNPSFALYFPNAFTPNSNGRNDVFAPKGYGINTYELLIFDRWGELVFQSNDLYTGWDGFYKNKLLPQDVYVYKCSILDMKLNPHTYIGKVTLVH